ncbi:hypothetical protein KH5_19970 [Urechidicola sp. KH5]
MIKKIALLAVLTALMGFRPTPTSTNEFIKSGEKLVFVASYNMSGIMTDIAEVKMETSTVKTKTRELLRLKCIASTYTKWDTYFRVRDLYESYVDKNTLLPSLFKRNIEEGTYKKELKYLFNRKANKAVSTLNKKGYNNYKTDVPIDANTLDIVSTIYKTRVLDFNSMQIGERATHELIVDSAVQYVTVEYRGREFIDVANLGKRECYKLSVAFGGSEIENIKGGKYIWITADDDRLPALIKANIPVGAVQIKLASFSK